MGTCSSRRNRLQPANWIRQCPRLRCPLDTYRYGSTETKAVESATCLGYNPRLCGASLLQHQRKDHRGGTLEVEGGGASPHCPETQNLFQLFSWQTDTIGYITNTNNKTQRGAYVYLTTSHFMSHNRYYPCTSWGHYWLLRSGDQRRVSIFSRLKINFHYFLDKH